MKFCSTCGAGIRLEIPQGDNRERNVCAAPDCATIHYVNPRIIVGAVCIWEERVLLCKRAIEPRTGFWTVPAGFMELGESAEEGAARESAEEAQADVEIASLLGAYSVARIGQVHLMFEGRLRSPEVGVGIESLEVGLFGWDEIPWDLLAFPSVTWALELYRERLPKVATRSQ